MSVFVNILCCFVIIIVKPYGVEVKSSNGGTSARRLIPGVIDSPISTVKTSYSADPITPTTPSPPILPRITRTGIRQEQEVTDDEDFEGSGYSIEGIPKSPSDTITNLTIARYENTTKAYRTFNGNETLLDCMETIADEAEPGTHSGENLTYTSHMINVSRDSTNITWQAKTVDGPKITVLEYAVHQLINSTIKMVVFETKNKAQFRGDIVVIKTKTIEEKSDTEAVLQIKFGKEKIAFSDNTNWTCVYWDRSISKWSDEGIKTEFEPEFIICSSLHLSTFSILLPDPDQILFNQWKEQESKHYIWLTRISRIGSLITIFFLILVIKHNYRKKTGKETRKILINSSIALLLTHGAYQIYTLFEGYSQCLIINFMKYYLVLAFLLWTAAEGVHMWRILLTDIFNTQGHIFYMWYKIISWGLPLITTFIGIFFFTSQGKCQLQFNKTYDLIFYMVPCVVILCCNLLLFIWMILNVTYKDRLGRLKDKKIEYVLALSQVFGIGWCVVFPFLYFESTQLVAEYLLAGVISTQGLLIFMVRGGIVKTIRQKLRDKSFGVSTWYQSIFKSSSSNASHTQQKNVSSVELDTVTRGYSETN